MIITEIRLTHYVNGNILQRLGRKGLVFEYICFNILVNKTEYAHLVIYLTGINCIYLFNFMFDEKIKRTGQFRIENEFDK